MKQYGFKNSHWHNEDDFDQIVKVRIDDAKKIELADDKKRKEIKEKPYCGHPDAAVIYKDKDSGEWVMTKNEETS